MSKLVTFDAYVSNVIFEAEDCKIYGVLPIDSNMQSEEGDDLVFNKYDNICIKGNIQKLSPSDTVHTITAEFEPPKNGREGVYNIKSIKTKKPATVNATEKFLNEILTGLQTENLMKVYPDIINIVCNGEDVDDDGKIILDLSEVKGIKEKIYTKIRYKIIESFPLIELLEEYGGYGITFANLKKMFQLYPSIEKIKQQMKDYPYKCLCSLSGIGFVTADSIILSIPIHKHLIDSPQRLKACINYNLSQNESNGNTYLNVKDLMNECSALVPQAMDIDTFIDMITNSDDIWFRNNQVARKKTRDAVEFIAYSIIYMNRCKNEWNIDIEKYREVDGIKMTDEQINGQVFVCKYNVSMIKGVGGTGKTQSIIGIVNMLEDNGYSYMLLAPTGKASNVMKDYLNRDAYTIHRGLAYSPNSGFQYNQHNKLKVDVVFVDENSMTDVFLMKALFEAIDCEKTKIVFIQDTEQIPSVGCGKCAYDMIESNIVNVSELTTIFRYAEGGLYKISTLARQGKSWLGEEHKDEIIPFGDNSDYIFFDTEPSMAIPMVVQLYKRLLNDKTVESLDDIMVLSGLKKGDHGICILNKVLQNEINPAHADKNEIEFGDKTFRVGDKVMQLHNSYNSTIYDIQTHTDTDLETTITNGECGIILDIDVKNKKVIVKFKSEIISLISGDLINLDLGYVWTIHKSQGSQAKHVILLTPTSHSYFLNKNLLYTALSRTKLKCYHVGNYLTVNSALKKSMNVKRNTMLSDVLIENKDKTKEELMQLTKIKFTSVDDEGNNEEIVSKTSIDYTKNYDLLDTLKTPNINNNKSNKCSDFDKEIDKIEDVSNNIQAIVEDVSDKNSLELLEKKTIKHNTININDFF